MGGKAGAAVRMRGTLQIDEELGYQQKTWIVQRLGWGIFAALVLAALLGVFGSGMLSRATAEAAGAGLRVEYERFARLAAPTELTLHLDRSRVPGERVHVVLAGDYLHGAELQSLLPPATGGLASAGSVLSFDAHGSTGEMTIVLHIKLARPGSFTGQVGLLDGPMLDINHWIYP